MLKVSKILLAAYQSWTRFITGEYWLKDDGDAEYADNDNGAGHEEIAVRDVLGHYADRFQMAFYQYFKGLQQEDPEEYQVAHQTYRHYFYGPDPEDFDFRNEDDGDCAEMYFGVGIPQEVGDAAMSPALWKEFRNDIRGFYSKHFNAAHVINTNFSVWQLTPKMIDAIQGFILEKADENGVGEDGQMPGSIHVEEVSTRHYSEIPCSDFMTMKYPNQVFQVAGKSARVQ